MGGEKDENTRYTQGGGGGGARINATCVANLKPPSPWSLFRQPVPAPPLWDFNNAARYGWSDDDRVKMQRAKYRCREPRRTGVPSKMRTREIRNTRNLKKWINGFVKKRISSLKDYQVFVRLEFKIR